MRPGIHVKHQTTRQKLIFKKTDKGFWYFGAQHCVTGFILPDILNKPNVFNLKG